MVSGGVRFRGEDQSMATGQGQRAASLGWPVRGQMVVVVVLVMAIDVEATHDVFCDG